MSLLVNNLPVVIVVSGEAKINNSKYKSCFVVKSKIISYDNVE